MENEINALKKTVAHQTQLLTAHQAVLALALKALAQLHPDPTICDSLLGAATDLQKLAITPD